MRKKILVIDDSVQARLMIAATLEEQGYDVVCSVDFADALQKAKAAKPDLVMIDVVMPDISGFDACCRIKDMFQPDPPDIIVMTGKLDAIDPIRARKMGADDFVVKTSNMSALLKAVRKIFSRKKVLVIDDSPTALGLIRSFLEENDYKVFTALNGRDGVAKAQEVKPDLAVVDVVLSDIDGFEVCRKIKAGVFASKVLLLATSADASVTSQISKCGADHFIAKSADLSDFSKAVIQLLE